MGGNCASALSSKSKAQKGPGKQKEKPKNDFLIEETGVADVDSQFQVSKGLLERLTSEQKHLKSTYQTLKKRTSANMLISPDVEDTAMAMLYILSAGVEGNLARINLELTAETPFIKVDESTLRSEHKEVAEQWELFTADLASAHPNMNEILDSINTEIRITEGVLDLAKECSASLDPSDQVRINNIVNKNLNKLKSAPKAIMETLEMQHSFTEKLTAFVEEKLKEGPLLSHVEDIGRQASRANVFDPKKIIMTYWPDEDRISHKK